jgi:HlyD family secretion protein
MPIKESVDQLNQIDGQIDAGKAQLNFAKESYNRLQAMYKDSICQFEQLDEVRMKLEMAKAQVASLNAKRKEVSQSARIEQIDQAKGQLDRAGAKEVLSAESENTY